MFAVAGCDGASKGMEDLGAIVQYRVKDHVRSGIGRDIACTGSRKDTLRTFKNDTILI
ncbi:hypothetical protein DPMN_047843 [Dreissena polymorpha]|uniref:Uncharacterized protein n=1 Tax=Dreissena polymorpha TaxID=45954 RepID=A0A9D4DAG9_DREPO|nr:hypothetical protein DPMN_047843 [Dreissena polymorpha]